MSTRPPPDPTKRIEDLPDVVTIGNRTFTELRLLDPIEHQQRLGVLLDVARACGCTLGGVLAVGSLMSYLAALKFLPEAFPQGMWMRIWLGLGVLMVGAGVGKLLGRLHAKRQFDHAAYDLEQRIMHLKRMRLASSTRKQP
jgi:hypothetical protein